MGSPDVRVIGGTVAYCLVVKLEEVVHEGFSLRPQFLFLRSFSPHRVRSSIHDVRRIEVRASI